METVSENIQLAIVNESIELFRAAPEILKDNRARSMKAQAVGNDILEQWHAAWNIKNEDERMAALAEADERSNKFLANCTGANKEMKGSRAAITQMMDEFKKLFTAAENEIDKTKPNSVASKVQNNRDTYATEVHKIEERKRREAELKAAKAKEAVEIKSDFVKNLNGQFNDHLLRAKQWLQGQFNTLSLEHFADEAAGIRTYKPEYKRAIFDKMIPYTSGGCRYHDQNELAAIAAAAKDESLFISFSQTYEIQMSALRDELKDKLTSKHEELKEQKRLADEAAAAAEKARIEEEERQKKIAAAKAEERERLEAEAAQAREEEARRQAELKSKQEAAAAEQKRREEAEASRLAAEAEETRRKAEEEAELKKQGEQTMIMFDQTAELATGAQAPEARQGYDIEVLHPAGYVQIFQHWFENEGKNLPVDKIGKTKMDQMKAWCEKRTQKTGEKIDSKFLKYTESFKAVNRK